MNCPFLWIQFNSMLKKLQNECHYQNSITCILESSAKPVKISSVSASIGTVNVKLPLFFM